MNDRAPFDGKLVIVGFGSVARASLPLIERHLGLPPGRITLIAPDALAGAEHGSRHLRLALNRGNYRATLAPLLSRGDFLLNLAVGVSSADLIQFAHEVGASYLDTGLDVWDEEWDSRHMTASERSNYALRERIRPLSGSHKPTAVVTHGANPGLVNHFVKQALLDLAAELLPDTPAPLRRRDWGVLARRLGVRVMHIAEHDSQRAPGPVASDEFINTWSVDGFVAECRQPAELGWGSHERAMPGDGHRHRHGTRASIYLERPGASVRARSWTPHAGPCHGFLITHGETVSLADYFTLRDRDGALYRPTVHYVYRPCDAALASLHDMAARNWAPPARQRILFDEISGGSDTLGVLLAGHARNAYWYGSQLTVEAARALAPHNNATTLQVAAGVVSGMLWALANPGRGLVEPEDMDHAAVLAFAAPYLGELGGVYTDWTPLDGRGELFREALDPDDPWQFRNVRVR